MVAINSDDLPSPSHHSKRKRLMKLQEKEEDDYVDEKKEKEEEESSLEDAKPIGEPVRNTERGKNKINHFHSFEFDGNQHTFVSLYIIFSFSPHSEPNSWAYIPKMIHILTSERGDFKLIFKVIHLQLYSLYVYNCKKYELIESILV